MAMAELVNGLSYEQREAAEGLLNFIEESPSMFHTVAALRRRLEAQGFAYLPEAAAWDCQPGGRYFTVRNNSSIIAFKVGCGVAEGYHFQATASHSDSPTFKVKAVADLEGPGNYKRLNVEAYGGSTTPGSTVRFRWRAV